MAAKIQIGADVQQATASLDVLEQRLRKVSAAAADIFKKATPRAQADLLRAYGVSTAAELGGHVLQSDRFMQQAARAARVMGRLVVRPETTLDPKLLAQGAKQLMNMGPLDSGPNMKLAAMGAAVSVFSPWIGARLLNESRVLRSLDRFLGGSSGASGGKGGLRGALFGGALEGFAEAYLVIRAMQALKHAFNELTDAVRRGANLYLNAAMVGTNPARLSHLQKTFEVLGLSAETAQRMLMMGQLRTGTKLAPGQLQGMVLGAFGRGAIGIEEMQAILNMSENVTRAWNMTADAARQSASSATDLFRVRFVFSQLREEWNTMWEQIASSLSGVISLFEMAAAMWLHFANMLLEGINKLMHLPGFSWIFGLTGLSADAARFLLPLKDPNQFMRQAVGPSMARPESMWEKMGLISHGGIGAVDYARQTAENTKKTVDILSGKWTGGVGHFGGPSTANDWTGGVGHFGVPNMP